MTTDDRKKLLLALRSIAALIHQTRAIAAPGSITDSKLAKALQGVRAVSDTITREQAEGATS